MEQLQQCSISKLHITILLLIFVALIIRSLFKKSKNSIKLPPGPWKFPIIGNMPQLVGGLPHHTLARLAKKHGPIMHLKLGEVSNIVISSAEYAREVMKTQDLNFSGRPFLLAAKIISYNSSIVYAPYGDYWRQMKKICLVELLSSKRVQSFRSIREEEGSNLVETISSCTGSVVNVSKMIVSTMNNITCNAAFGKRYNKDQETFVSLIDEIMEVGAGFGIAEMFPSIKFLQSMSGVQAKIEKLHEKLDKILQNIVREHQALRSSDDEHQVAGDLVDVLLNLQENGGLEFPLTVDNVKGVILDIFTAGSETTSAVLEWAMSELIKNPNVMEKAQAEVRLHFSNKRFVDETNIKELSYLKLIIKETLRLHSPVPLLVPRENMEQCVIDGYDIPAKTKIIINAWLIGRDPNNWIEPEKFYPERFLDSPIDYKGSHFKFIPFGGGRRICPGVAFGIANAELTLANLLLHFDWKLPSGMKPEDLDMVETFGASARRRTSLCLIPIPHSPEQFPNDRKVTI